MSITKYKLINSLDLNRGGLFAFGYACTDYFFVERSKESGAVGVLAAPLWVVVCGCMRWRGYLSNCSASCGSCWAWASMALSFPFIL